MILQLAISLLQLATKNDIDDSPSCVHVKLDLLSSVQNPRWLFDIGDYTYPTIWRL